MSDTITIHEASVYQVRERILLEAASVMCRHCAGSRGHHTFPTKRFDRWEHLFMVGNGSNPCAAGPIWELIQQCEAAMGTRYTPLGEKVSAGRDDGQEWMD
jgi:hypothetical protein